MADREGRGRRPNDFSAPHSKGVFPRNLCLQILSTKSDQRFVISAIRRAHRGKILLADRPKKRDSRHPLLLARREFGAIGPRLRRQLYDAPQAAIRMNNSRLMRMPVRRLDNCRCCFPVCPVAGLPSPGRYRHRREESRGHRSCRPAPGSGIGRE
jgi:hypothetical protein